MEEHEVHKGNGCAASVYYSTVCLDTGVGRVISTVVCNCKLHGDIHHHVRPILSGLNSQEGEQSNAKVLEVGIHVQCCLKLHSCEKLDTQDCEDGQNEHEQSTNVCERRQGNDDCVEDHSEELSAAYQSEDTANT